MNKAEIFKMLMMAQVDANEKVDFIDNTIIITFEDASVISFSLPEIYAPSGEEN